MGSQYPSAWVEHVPFGMAMIDLVRPRTLVELGTYSGVSYCAFCQATAQFSTGTRCFAVDTWRGDAHTGPLDNTIFNDLSAYHDARYASFSTLLRSTFDDALAYFAAGSIDLLHIDGYHTYEAVRRDF